ncbi:similar to Saccharomyces cerevisiae YPL115C BEM3 Rho GTPase activating protein (RhoGAP) involved in control of the cytoskeleton organization [Maudiozyma barnettii]|uniref:Similar to Saccharomyces cerevisiae YPL115C BEM3 Rho GTPase activating protein (RhoGAP) involved in control of the cytoskeleton organization n=1 Tax=Maudiozyma barnettii TaxID=61262 RepID=A0A8H2VCK3_9SACH|nr:GTPase-activating protein BEM3 [Kazachstania barnettii]CAB4252753.1 similar to Saccharomyces cerevisiae YPL115C BEM3 Rho GTPase activating protein (RhoGAP) involved in control of the cytoskeleton organization [Kazachstania barnettii]CAD1780543.1 similar to Saccharomyces cerevisiae YPL115C BEM3 Rho GTPase activating protein (RhoGAP) involved in control of the cytoskeleton organization [Kazachstania barnettii]
MTTKAGTSATLDLLAQYNNHIQERDKVNDDIEGKSELDDNRPTYDDLFKENVKLKLDLKERQKEIISLKKVINLMQHDKNTSVEDLISQVTSDEMTSNEKKKEIVLPPRSIERSGLQKDNGSHFSSPEVNERSELTASRSSPSNPFSEKYAKLEPDQNDNGNDDEIEGSMTNIIETAQVAKIHDGSSTTTTNNSVQSSSNVPTHHLLPSQTPSLTSPATSVTYTTSRITIKSPNRRAKSPVQERLNSPQSVNRVTSVINNHLHSPLKSDHNDRDVNMAEQSSQYSQIDSNLDEDLYHNNKSPLRSARKELDISPNAKAKLNTFSQLLADSFGEEDKLSSPYTAENQTLRNNTDTSRPLPPVPPKFFSPSNPSIPVTPVDVALGSPVILNRTKDKYSAVGSSLNNQTVTDQSQMASAWSMNKISGNDSVSSNEPLRVPSTAESIDSGRKPPLKEISSNTSHNQNLLKVESGKSRVRANSIGTVTSSNTSTLASDIPLFVQPNDLHTIQMDIISTLYFDPQSNSGDNSILFGVIDKSSGKEMFKFSKSIQKVRELDVYLKSHVSSLSLPTLPERTLFQTTVPTRVDYRREHLKNYFNSIAAIPELPGNVSLKISQFLSTDTVMSPFLLEDTQKEGSLLMRRPKKALGGNISWRVRYGILNGDFLQLFEGGDMMETIRLKQASLELLPNMPDDKYGTKNGFLIVEQKKVGLSSSSKYFICAESPKERQSWLAALSEFIDTAKLSTSSPTGESTGIFSSSTSNSLNESTDQVYVTNLAQSDNAASSQSSQPNSADSFQATSYDQFSNSGPDDDKDIKRNKMRSLFPFKKFSNMTNNTLHANSHNIGHQNMNNSRPVSANDESDKSMNMDNEYSMRSDSSMIKTSPNYGAKEPSQGVVFGASIETSLKLSSHSYQGVYEIPSVVYRCLEYLYKNRGIQEEGIFRLSGSSTMIKTLQEEFDRDYDIDLCNYKQSGDNPSNVISVNTISGLLKLYLRNLPHLIVGDEQFLLFKKAVDDHHDDPYTIAIEFRKIIRDKQVPHANISLMYALFELLTRINENHKINKMNLRNLCIVFSQTLNIPITMLQPFIVDFNCVFKDGEPIRNENREELDIHIPGV